MKKNGILLILVLTLVVSMNLNIGFANAKANIVSTNISTQENFTKINVKKGAKSKKIVDKKLTITTCNKKVSGLVRYTESKKLLKLVNDFRSENDLETVKWRSSIKNATKARAGEITYKWSHERPNGTQWYTANKKLNGENLAYGYNTAEEVFNGWCNSPGHRANMLNPEFKYMYVIDFEKNNTNYWVQHFCIK